MPIEYVVKRAGKPWEADVLESGEKVATLEKSGDFGFILKTKEGKIFYLDQKVDGLVTPFSMAAYEEKGEGKKQASNKTMVLKIKNNLFSHNGRMYIMKNVPEGRPLGKHILGSKYISRLDNFPFKTPDEIDPETKERLGRHRGVEVGEMSGLGINGHKVRLDDELKDIALPLSVVSYLFYSTG